LGEGEAGEGVEVQDVVQSGAVNPAVALHLPPEGEQVDHCQFQLNHPLRPGDDGRWHWAFEAAADAEEAV